VKRILTVLMGVTAVLAAEGAFAGGDPVAGKMKVGVCAACHGVAGVSNQDVWPNLAAQRPDYLVKQLKAFKGGSRTNKVMNAVAKYLSDDDMNNLSAYFAMQTSSPPQTASTEAVGPAGQEHPIN
jgi:cytochrome c553